MLSEVTINDHVYGIGQLDAIKQMHIVRRVAPLLTSLGVGIGEDGKPKVENPFAALQPTMELLADMPDDRFEYVVKTSLSAVYRRTESGWARVMPNGVIMFSDDLDMPTQLQLVWEVGKANLAGFTNMFRALGDKGAPGQP